MYYPTVVYNGSIVDPRDSNIGFQWGDALLSALPSTPTCLPIQPWAFSLDSSLE